MKSLIYIVGGGLIGWYLGTQQEAKTRELYEKLKAKANELQAQLNDVDEVAEANNMTTPEFVAEMRRRG